MTTTSPQELLKNVYDQLGYNEGPLYSGGNEPVQFSKEDWIEKGEWLALTKEVGAEKIFFVKNNPVAVFAKSSVNEPEVLRQLFNKIWCMSRPRLLFLAYPGELAVYDLATEPARKTEWEKIKPLEFAKSANEVAGKLKAFRREQIETGRLFEEYRFGDINSRADKALINDLKEVRRELIAEGLNEDKIKYAHVLIGRSIFIRYLEDRKILIPEDFYEVASNNKKWEDILKSKVPRAGINLSEEDPLYARVLSDKEFTFALFKKLAKDFNGDIFPDVEEEERFIKQQHFWLIQDLLFGDVGRQKKLFFYAYKFEIIPIELISSIYEEFYHPEVNKQKERKSSEGAYYTPPALVEFLVNQVITPERLDTKPKVLDPSCGSGIFLVEAFRRIVRHRRLELGKKPTFQNLQKILREQIAGIEINPEAVRIAAFSLYLAMLHYLDPPSIREQIYTRGNRLPKLIFDEEEQKEKSYNTLLTKNAFDSDYILNNPVLSKTFASNCADIVIGNPPWGSPKGEGEEAKKANNIAVRWCQRRVLPVGKGERSQLFIWRALDLSKPNGIIGLLVHFNSFLMHHDNSEEFREKWLRKSDLQSVFNLSHVRDIFFSAIAPFAGVIFENCTKKKNQSIEYWSAKHSKVIEQSQSVVLNKSDLRYIRKDQPLHEHQLWKTYWWGNHQDECFLTSLKRHRSLLELSPEGYHGRGFEVGDKKYPSDWLLDYKEFPTSAIERYGPLSLNNLTKIPNKVHDRGIKKVYNGMRILIKRGIRQRGRASGQIVARYVKDDFAFRNSIYGIKLTNEKEWMYKCLLGILWSSLAKYYLLLTTYDFGVWHDEIRLKDELMQLPICFPKSETLRNKITGIVDKLQSKKIRLPLSIIYYINRSYEFLTSREIAELEDQLDKAVFELYELSDAEIDLIHDMCEVTLPYYYSPDKSMAGKPVLTRCLSKPYGTMESLPKNTDILGYLKVFIQSWIPYLDNGTEFGWQIYQPEQTDSMIAVVFSVKEKNKEFGEYPMTDIKCWNDVLIKLENNLKQPFHSSRIYTEGMVRAVSDDFIMIIKLNERRLWTRSMAREDAEATLVQAMNREDMRERIIQKQ